MPEWTDKDTDKLFQEGANRYDFTYDPTAWEAMEQLLDRDRRRRLLWWWLGAVVVLLLVAWMSWRWLSGRASGAEEPVAAQVSQGPEAVSDEVVLAGSPESTGEREPAKTPTSDEISKGH
ncbi:MAG: hypothetical protein KDC54_18055, partial [Lewinella sp.]|nr:hypothetical protein [Lewinella sp.]